MPPIGVWTSCRCYIGRNARSQRIATCSGLQLCSRRSRSRTPRYRWPATRPAIPPLSRVLSFHILIAIATCTARRFSRRSSGIQRLPTISTRRKSLRREPHTAIRSRCSLKDEDSGGARVEEFRAHAWLCQSRSSGVLPIMFCVPVEVPAQKKYRLLINNIQLFNRYYMR